MHKHALASPRSNKGLSDKERDLLAHLVRLVGREVTKDDPSYHVIMGEKTVPLTLLALERICYEIERRGNTRCIQPRLLVFFSHVGAPVGLETEGIFRIPGGSYASTAVWASLSHLKSGEEVQFKSEPNVHNIASGLICYLSHVDSTVPLYCYKALFACIKPESPPVEFAVRLMSCIAEEFPLQNRKVLHRVMKLCFECSKHSAVNQMTPRNLAIVFSPVLFRDETESSSGMTSTIGMKIHVIETIIGHYSTVFPAPYESTYKPPLLPGECPSLGLSDWNLILAKAELTSLRDGQVLYSAGQAIGRLHRIRNGTLELQRGADGSRSVLIAGDMVGERLQESRLCSALSRQPGISSG